MLEGVYLYVLMYERVCDANRMLDASCSKFFKPGMRQPAARGARPIQNCNNAHHRSSLLFFENADGTGEITWNSSGGKPSLGLCS
eukprot:scaffold84055_cov45-Attheya_sp.AAC.6